MIGEGIWNTKELTSILYSRKLIPDPSPTHLIQYLKNLEEMELVESIKLYKTKGRYYRLISPLMNIYYYLDSRYDISNRTISLEEIRPTLQNIINLEIQNFIADLFAEIYEGRKEYAEETAGGYYAARIGILEKMKEMKRQHSCLALRFISSEYNMLLGVWVCREAARKSLQEKPLSFVSQELMLHYAKEIIKRKFGFEIDVLLKESRLLKEKKEQRRLGEF